MQHYYEVRDGEQVNGWAVDKDVAERIAKRNGGVVIEMGTPDYIVEELHRRTKNRRAEELGAKAARVGLVGLSREDQDEILNGGSR